jgi:phage shock protein A
MCEIYFEKIKLYEISTALDYQKIEKLKDQIDQLKKQIDEFNSKKIH